MHIVILVGNYYPDYSAVGICAKNFSEALERSGYAVSIISQRTSLSEESHVGHPQSIYRIDSFWLKCIIRGEQNGLFSKLISKYGRTVRYLQSIVQRCNVKWDIVKAYVEELKSISVKEEIDVVIPFCFPFESILAAVHFKQKKLQNVKIIPYLFDRFAASDALHRTRWNKYLKMSAHIRLEQSAFAECDGVLAMPSWIKHVKRYNSHIADKFVQVEHPLLVPIKSSKYVSYDKSAINIVFTGSLLKVIRSPQNSFKSLVVAIQSRPNIRVHLYTRGNCEDDIREFERQCPGQVVYHGSVDIETAHAAMSAADILLSVGNANITQMASKNFEYIATGSPVIHFYCDKLDPVNVLLSKMGNCLMLSQHDSPEHNGKAIVDFLAGQLVKHTFEEVAKIIPEALPETTVDVLKNMINKNV